MLCGRMGTRRNLLAWIPAALGLAAAAAGQTGYKTFENKLKGVTFVYPTTHQELPLQPDERVLVAKYVMKQQPEELKRVDERLFKAQTPTLQVFRFRLPGAKTGNRAAPDTKPVHGDAAADAVPQMTWETFLVGLQPWLVTEDAKKPGCFVLASPGGFGGGRGRGDERPTFQGYLVRKIDGNTVLGVFGYSYAAGAKTLEAQVTRMAASLKVSDEDAGDKAEAEIDKLYASGKFKAVEWRKQVRSKMASGWKAYDTENYLIVHHSTNMALVKRIARDIEAMRAFYGEQFPPSKPIDAVAIVRICRTMDEYHEYGGSPNTGGYWHPVNEELVFFDYSYTMKTLDSDEKRALGGQKLTDDDSLLVLYHEALHQYMHYAVGEFAPHDWFNEGYGDYFSGAVVGESTGRVLRVEPSPWRLHLAKDMCEHGEGFLALKDVLHAEHSTFYNAARMGHYYAAAWSFVHFLKHGKEAAQNPQWSKLLPTYFEAVKAAYQKEAKDLAKGDERGRHVAAFQARKAALAKTLEGIDLPALEAAWRKYVVEMKDPWPALRKKRR